MTSGDGATLQHHRTIFDGWRSMSLSLFMSLAGYAVLVGVPVISNAWVNLLGFSEVEVGRVAGADLGGLSLGALVAALLVAKINRRLLTLLAIAIAVGANAMCMFIVEYEPVLWLRLTAGFGSGVYTAIAVCTLGATSKPARAFNIMLFAFAFSQMAELYFLPKLSMNAIYTVFIVAYLITLPFLRWLPPHPVDNALDIEVDVEEQGGCHHVEHQHVPTYVPWLVLAAIVMTYINIGGYWAYIKLATIGTAADPDWVDGVLVWVSLFSIVGCLFATLISNRFGLARPLMLALLSMAMIVGMLLGGINNVSILISAFSFNFLWIFVDVYQMATIANVDHSGKYAALLPGAQGLGNILGPNLAASILAAGYGYSGVFIMCTCAALTGMLIYASMYIRLRQAIPALANAS